MSYIGVTKDLVRVPQDTILKARVRMQAVQAESWLIDQPVLAEHLQAARLRLEQLVEEWGDLKAQLTELKSRTRSRSREAVQNLRKEVKEARSRYRVAYREWVWSLQNPHLISLPA